MATGASTANLAIILIDARNGVLPQSRRHAFIAALLGIPHIVVAVNKMDLVEFRRGGFTIPSAPSSAPSPPRSTPARSPLSRSAPCMGDNVVTRSRIALVRRAQRCSNTWKLCPLPPTATSPTCVSRCST